MMLRRKFTRWQFGLLLITLMSCGLITAPADGATGAALTNVFTLDTRLTPTIQTITPGSGSISGGTAQISVTVEASDGTRITNETVNLTADRGQIDATAKHQGNGVYTSTYTAATIAGEVKLTAVTGNGKLGTTTIRLTEREIDPAKSTVVVDSSVVAADGKTQATVTITVVDKQGLPLSGKKVELSTDVILKELNLLQPSPTDADGLATAKISSTKAGVVTITATVDGVALSQKPTIEFISGDVAHGKIEAGGLHTVGEIVPVTVTLKNAQERPVAGKTVELGVTPAGGVKITQPTAKTDASGITTATFTSTKVELKTISAKVVEDNFTLTETAAVLFDAAAPEQVSVSAVDSLVVSGSATVKASVTDGYGNPVKNTDVKFTATLGGLTASTNNGDGTYTATYTAPARIAGVQPPQTTITATTPNGKTGSAKITIKEAGLGVPKSIAIIPNTARIRSGQTQQFLITGDGSSIPAGDVTWEVIGGMGEMGTDGIFTATKIGDGTIKATLKADTKVTTQTGTITVTPGEAQSVTLKANPNQIAVGETSTLTVTVRDSQGNPVSGETLTLEVLSGPGVIAEKIIDTGDGTYLGTYTASGNAGTATLIAKTTNGKIGNVVITVTPKSQAAFVLSALKTEMTAAAGGFATYLITLKGENGFAAAVTLFTTDDLPAKVEATFAPKTVTLSAGNPLTDSQLTLTLPAESTPGAYPFTILAVPVSGETKRLTLTLQIESKPIFNTSLSLVLPKTTVRFMEPLDVRGELLSDDAPAEVGNATIQITFAAPGGKTRTFETQTDSEKSYHLETPFLPDEVGTWTVKARFDGNARLKSSERERTFTVTKGSAEIRFSTGLTGALGDEIELIGTLSPPLKGQPLSLKILRPDGSASTLTGIITDSSGMFLHPLKLELAGDWEITTTWAGNQQYESVTQRLVISVSQELGKAILVLGGGNRQDNPAWERFNGLAEYVYAIFRKRRFRDEDIYFLSPDPKQTTGADNVTSLTALEFAITHWAQVNSQVPLYIYLLSHNVADQFLLEKHGNSETFLSPALLAEWLSQLPEGTPVTIIIEACYGENFIRTSSNRPTALVGPNRTFIVSTRWDQQANLVKNTGRGGKSITSFSNLFFHTIDSNKTVETAFRETVDQMRRSPVLYEQFPVLDANGNGIGNENQDFVAVAERYLPADIGTAGLPPEFLDVTPAQTLSAGISSATIEVELLGVGITDVFATVIPPNFDPTQRFDSWSALDFDGFDLVQIGKDPVSGSYTYAGTYDHFTLPGDYTVIVNAENPDGSAAPVQTTITVPSVPQPATPWDVNGDGTVNVLDLVLVSSHFGQVGAGLSGDVNGDGVVNVSDLVLVGSHLGERTVVAAPNLSPGPSPTRRGEKAETKRTDSPFPLREGGRGVRSEPLQQALAALEAMPNLSRAEMMVRDFLRSWLTDVAPLVTETKLLPNYPNPFNPETWIPFQLASDAEVRIMIYDINGALGRQLELGHHVSGFYTEPSTAAYWDGRNRFGEAVSSGVYFYRMVAGDYTEMRRMVILK